MTGEQNSDDGGETADVIGYSVRGQKHIKAGIPCQDANECRTLRDSYYIIAAADGLGSADLAHIGSSEVTEKIVDYIEGELADVDLLEEEMLQSILCDGFHHVREQLYKEANVRDKSVTEFNTTLLVAVGGPSGVAGAAVGDGGIVWHRGSQTGLLVSRENKGYANETTPVQSKEWETSYRFGWMADADAAAVFSDGLDILWDGPESVKQEPFDQIFANPRDFSNLNRLDEFLNCETIRNPSADDKTIVVGALPASAWSDPSEGSVTPPVDPGLDSAKQPSADVESGPTQGGVNSAAGTTDRIGDGDFRDGKAATQPGKATAQSSGVAAQPNNGEGVHSVKAEVSGLGEAGTEGLPDRVPRIENLRLVGIVVVGITIVIIAALLGGLLIGDNDEGTTTSGNGGSETSIPTDEGNGMFAPTGEGDGTGLVLSSVELRGAEGLIISGYTSDGIDGNYMNNISIGIREAQRSDDSQFNLKLEPESPDINTSKSDDGQFTLTLDPDLLETEATNFDYYGNTTYDVVVEVVDGSTASMGLERGKLDIAIETPTVANDMINVTGQVTQNGEPVHESNPELEFMLDGDPLSVVHRNDSVGDGWFDFSLDRNDASNDQATLSAMFAGATETVTVGPPQTANFSVTINESNAPITGDDPLAITATVTNVANETGAQNITLSIDGTVVDSTQETLPAGDSAQVALGWNHTEVGNYTATVASLNDTRLTEITINEQKSNRTDTAGTTNATVNRISYPIKPLYVQNSYEESTTLLDSLAANRETLGQLHIHHSDSSVRCGGIV